MTIRAIGPGIGPEELPSDVVVCARCGVVRRVHPARNNHRWCRDCRDVEHPHAPTAAAGPEEMLEQVIRDLAALTRSAGTPALTLDNRIAIAQAYAEGEPVANIAARFNCADATVGHIARTHGIRRRQDRRRGSREAFATTVEKLLTEHDALETAEILGLSPAALSSRMRRVDRGDLALPFERLTRRRRGTCADCGGSTSQRSAARCLSCHRQHAADSRKKRAQTRRSPVTTQTAADLAVDDLDGWRQVKGKGGITRWVRPEDLAS